MSLTSNYSLKIKRHSTVLDKWSISGSGTRTNGIDSTVQYIIIK